MENVTEEVYGFLPIFRGGGVTKNNIKRELSKKEGLGQLLGSKTKSREEGVFERRLIPRCTL